MRSLKEILENGTERPAFSNDTSWEIWSSRWCEECVHDINEDCPLILASFMYVLPQEWIEVGLQNYECTEFEPREEQQ